MTAPVSTNSYPNIYNNQNSYKNSPRYDTIDNLPVYHDKPETPKKLDDGYYYRETNQYDRVNTNHLRHDEPRNSDDGYYYKDVSYENHPKKDIDGNPNNDWIPILTRNMETLNRKHEWMRKRLAKSPLKKLVNNVKGRIFRSEASITTAAALGLPYLALALPS